jgi:hypothetical protein
MLAAAVFVFAVAAASTAGADARENGTATFPFPLPLPPLDFLEDFVEYFGLRSVIFHVPSTRRDKMQLGRENRAHIKSLWKAERLYT